MKKEFLTLAHHYHDGMWDKSWMVSRKLNGWACLWDGGITLGKLTSDVPWAYLGKDKPLPCTGLWSLGRGNNPKVINCPEWFYRQLPAGVPLQGELWKDDDLSYVKSVCGQGESGRVDYRWKGVTFQAYNVKPYSLFASWMVDSPFYKNDSWINRLRTAKMTAPVGAAWAWLEQSPCSKAEAVDWMQRSLDRKWEGLMFVNPYGYYQDYRSYDLLKWKPIFETECVVEDYVDGLGRHDGRMGSLLGKLTWDEKVNSIPGGEWKLVGKEVTFGVSGFSDDERGWEYVFRTWPRGKEIKIIFSGVTNDGVPASARILR